MSSGWGVSIYPLRPAPTAALKLSVTLPKRSQCLPMTASLGVLANSKLKPRAPVLGSARYEHAMFLVEHAFERR